MIYRGSVAIQISVAVVGVELEIRLPVFSNSDQIRKMGGRARTQKNNADAVDRSLWLASNPSKRWAEAFFLVYTLFWLTLCLGIVVPFKLYESFTELEYLLLALVSVVPLFLIPFVLVGKADKDRPLKDRYWLKAHL